MILALTFLAASVAFGAWLAPRLWPRSRDREG